MTFEKTEFEFPDEVEDKKEPEAKVPEEVQIEVVDDTPEADRGRKPMKTPPMEVTEEDLNKYDASTQSRIRQFTKGYHDERRAKEAALREREEALKVAQAIIEENKKLRGSLSQGNTALLTQARSTVDKELLDARAKYKAAAEAFDSNAMLEAQEELTSAKLRAAKLADIDEKSLQMPETEVKLPTSASQAPQLDEKVVKWKEKNTWFGDNKRMTAYALGLHEDLVNEGIPVGSDKYYERIDADMQERFPEVLGEAETVAKPQAKPKSNVVAPATRSTAARKVVLTQSQVNTAKRLGVPLELYARKVAELERNAK